MSPMGSSGGRSAGNRTGSGATRRFTEREREDVDPPWTVESPYVLTAEGRSIMRWLSYGAASILGLLVIWILAALFDLV